jgi:uncharacterized protein
MDGLFLRFYMREDQRHQHQLAWEWMLNQANKLGIQGGSAFKSMAGFGRHHKLHEAKFFELTGLGIEVEFVVTKEEADKLLAYLSKEKTRFFYSTSPVHFGVINPESGIGIRARSGCGLRLAVKFAHLGAVWAINPWAPGALIHPSRSLLMQTRQAATRVSEAHGLRHRRDYPRRSISGARTMEDVPTGVAGDNDGVPQCI